MPDNITYGTSGDDILSGGNGTDTIYGGDGNDIISGGNGVDNLFGEGGNDQLTGDNGNDNLTGGEGDDLIDGKLGVDIAYYSGSISEYRFLASAGYLHIMHVGGTGADGHDQVINVEQLVFADRVINLGSGNNVPVAFDDLASIDEDTGTHDSGAVSVLDNDFDFDGDAMTVTAGTFTGTYGTLTLNSNGTYSYTLFASAQGLALGEGASDSFDYTVSDNDGSDTGTLVFNIAGLNDAPVANPDSAATGENAGVQADVLANDTDIDNGAVLSVTAASAPLGQGTASVVNNQIEYDPGSDFDTLAVGESAVVTISYTISDEHGATASSTLEVTVNGANDGPVASADTGATTENATVLLDVLTNDTDIDNGAVLSVASASAPLGQGTASAAGTQVEFNPGTDFDNLAVGETEEVIVNYTMTDEHGATASSTVTITVTGENDGPVANADARNTPETSAVVVDVVANDVDVDNGAVLTVTSVSSPPAGQGTVSIVENQIRFDPGDDFDSLASGETAVVVLDYTIDDEFGAQSSSTLTITVQGRDEGSSTTGTDEGETLIGTPGDDTIDALGGDDTVFGLEGSDLITGGDGRDQLYGEGDDDTVEGGAENDFLSGGDGNDQLSGDAGNDVVFGDAGSDQISGGDGFDLLLGDAGEDNLQGGNDDDYLAGGDDDDVLSGGAGGDELLGEAGADTLSGGADNDVLDGGAGNDSLDGGDGADFLISGDGTDTLSGGAGDDVFRHSTRNFASTITTGLGSDTIELSQADVYTDPATVITVTDFTTGAGGDVFALTALLGSLSGWDGSSNPFGSGGFLRLTQDGADTVLEWDQDGSGGGSDWQALAVLQATDAASFTGANFEPAYHPDGSAPAGETITGTADGDTLFGTVGNDTINALAGNDTVHGGAGADQIDGGDDADILLGEADNDVIAGGNDDDTLAGGDGNDQLLGQAGNDSLDGGAGDDSLDGGDGDDFLAGGGGTDTYVGGLGNDQILADSTGGVQSIDAGDGTDTIHVQYRYNPTTITTGLGADTIELADPGVFTDPDTAITVTDFTPGAGGDVFGLTGVLRALGGWDGSSNPFGSGGFLRLTQDGADTVLEWDQDGASTESDWQTLAVLENTAATALTSDNFSPGYSPAGDAPTGETITGTAENDTLIGTIGGDTIDALGGHDTVFGQAGADQISGGDGDDILLGEADDDVIAGGNGEDTLSGGEGADTLSGEAGSDFLYGDAGGDQLSGGADTDILDGGDGDDALLGGDGDDLLRGGSGSDDLTGGAGADIFEFRDPSHGPDEVADFVSGVDQLRISASGFGGGLQEGGSVSLVSGSDPAASGASGQFLFDTDDGRLLWDADGTGGGEAVLIATFTSLPSLTSSDFVLI